MPSPQSVQDRPAETGIKVNNILTGLVLASILWVGNSIMDIKEIIASMDKHQALLTKDVSILEDRLEMHLKGHK